MKKKWFSVKEVADILGLAATTIYSLCEQRKIEHLRVGVGRGAIRISHDALDAFISESMVEAERVAEQTQ